MSADTQQPINIALLKCHDKTATNERCRFILCEKLVQHCLWLVLFALRFYNAVAAMHIAFVCLL